VQPPERHARRASDNPAMGCGGSKPREFSSDIDRRVIEMLKRIKQKRMQGSGKFVVDGKSGGDFKSFDKMVLAFPKIRRAFLRVKEVFKSYDADGSESIDKDELGACLAKLGAKLTEAEVQQMFSEANMHSTGTLDFNEFLLFLCIGAVLQLLPHLESVDVSEAKEGASEAKGGDEKKGEDDEPSVQILEGGAELVEAIRIAVEAYLLFDADASGTIDREEVQNIIDSGGGGKGAKGARGRRNSNSTPNALLSKDRWGEMDWDKDGTITFKEFLWALLGWVGMNDDLED